MNWLTEWWFDLTAPIDRGRIRFRVHAWLWRHCTTLRYLPGVPQWTTRHYELRRATTEPGYTPRPIPDRQAAIAHLARLKAAHRRVWELVHAA